MVRFTRGSRRLLVAAVLAAAWPVLQHHAGRRLRESLRSEVGLPAGQA